MGILKWLLRGLGALVLVALAAPVLLWLTVPMRETAATDLLPGGRLVETAMGRIHVEEAGPQDGVPVLLVHGSVGWAGLWQETSAALAGAGYRAIAFDMPPMGWSDRDPARGYGRDVQGRRVLALVDALGVRPILVAHSFGAGAGSEAVLASPGAFLGYVVVDGALGLGRGEPVARAPVLLRARPMREIAVAATITNPVLTERLLRLFLFRKDRAAGYVELVRAPFALKGSTAAMADWLPTLLTNPDLPSTRPEDYAGLALPVTILWGAEDTTTPLAQGAALAAAIAGAKLVVLEDVGHIPQIEDPVAFQGALLQALAAME